MPMKAREEVHVVHGTVNLGIVPLHREQMIGPSNSVAACDAAHIQSMAAAPAAETKFWRLV